MKITSRVYSITILILTSIGLIGASGPAVAQQAGQTMEEVIVTAPVERHQVVGRSLATGAKIEVIKLQRQVDYADLDLSRHKDVMELDNRIAAVAKESCEKLSRMFLEGMRDKSEVQSCTAKAIESAAEARKIAIAAVE